MDPDIYSFVHILQRDQEQRCVYLCIQKRKRLIGNLDMKLTQKYFSVD